MGVVAQLGLVVRCGAAGCASARFDSGSRSIGRRCYLGWVSSIYSPVRLDSGSRLKCLTPFLVIHATLTRALIVDV